MWYTTFQDTASGQLVHIAIIPHPAAGDLLRLVLIQECLRWNPPPFPPPPPPILGDREAEKEADIWGFLLGVEEEEEEAAWAPEASSVSMSSRSNSSLRKKRLG